MSSSEANEQDARRQSVAPSESLSNASLLAASSMRTVTPAVGSNSNKPLTEDTVLETPAIVSHLRGEQAMLPNADEAEVVDDEQQAKQSATTDTESQRTNTELETAAAFPSILETPTNMSKNPSAAASSSASISTPIVLDGVLGNENSLPSSLMSAEAQALLPARSMNRAKPNPKALKDSNSSFKGSAALQSVLDDDFCVNTPAVTAASLRMQQDRISTTSTDEADTEPLSSAKRFSSLKSFSDSGSESSASRDVKPSLAALNKSSSAAAAANDEVVEMKLLGSSDFTIVNVHNNAGAANVRGTVKLVRNPKNATDSNTIDVLNSSKAKLGNIDAHEAAHLAPLLDQYPNLLVTATVAGPDDDCIIIKVRYYASHPSIENSVAALHEVLGPLFQPAPGADNSDKKPAHPRPIQLASAAAPPDSPGSLSVSSSSTEGETIEELKVFGYSMLTLVGMQYHSGHGQVTVGDKVKLVREPLNIYDANAIRVDNMSGTPIGHIERKQAQMLAVLMDLHKAVHYNASIAGKVRHSALPVKVEYAATSEAGPIYKAAYKKQLKQLFQILEGESAGSDSRPDFASSGGQSSHAPPPSAPRIIGFSLLTLVGMRYHSGCLAITTGDQVQLVREPYNKHDPNAVRVDTMAGETIGHVEREQARFLSYVMDSTTSLVYLSAIGAQRYSKVPLVVRFACAPADTATCLAILRSFLTGLFHTTDGTASNTLALAGMNGIVQNGLSRAVEARVQTQVVDWEGQREEIDELFEKQSENLLENLPPYELPPLLSHLTFYDYQKQGVSWLINQEKPSIPSYWSETVESGMKVWKCALTGEVVHNEPKPIQSAILADDMGLGKTLQTLALILANPPKGYDTYPLPKSIRTTDDAPRTTLIVSPLSVMAAWQSQIDQHINRYVADRTLTVRVYHGSNRGKVLQMIESGQVDIVLASYQTLASDLSIMRSAMRKADASDDDALFELPRAKKKQRGDRWIFDLCFHRLVLDEAHMIKNSKAKMFEAVTSLTADRKLCLTGTPMTNAVTDIHSLLAFLEVQPLGCADVFKRFIVNPIRAHKEIGLDRLRTVMSYICLRRKKQKVMQTIKLVPKTVEIRSVEFPAGSEHKRTYDALYDTARAYFIDALETSEDGVFGKFSEMLGLILYLRRSCNHLSLVPHGYRTRATESRATIMKLCKKEGKTLLEYLRGAFNNVEQLVECAVCMNELEEKDAVILRKCRHIFCEPCLNQIHNQLCPLCRDSYTSDDMVKKHTAEAAVKQDVVDINKEIQLHTRSPKVQAMLDAIDEMKADEKAVIFSQWTTMLDIVAGEFRTLGIKYTRIDGTMNAQARVQAMKEFEMESTEKKEAPRFILCSLMACGTGISLTRGNVVFILDPWWQGVRHCVVYAS
ncbi:hypothetical protein MPSEU_000401200 [Mayamaea pseudoterrestris]|nr:hypothetical protein MPSEU_000401200 [Mayamaea pseudoterrestris]